MKNKVILFLFFIQQYCFAEYTVSLEDTVNMYENQIRQLKHQLEQAMTLISSLKLVISFLILLVCYKLVLFLICSILHLFHVKIPRWLDFLI